VLLLHPGLWDSRTWDPQVPVLAARGYRAIRYDLRGYGRSSRLTGAAYSHVDDAVALLDHLGVESAALVGCSMGGAIAIDIAVSHPDRPWALVVAASGLAGFEENDEEIAWWDAATEGLEELIEAGDLEAAEDLRLEVWAPLGTHDEAGAAIRRIAFDNLHEITMDESAEVELNPPAAARLHEVVVPTLVVKAEHDPPFMRRCSDTIAAGIPGARIVEIDGADHVVNLRQPQAFDAAVIPFLDQVRP
jgi:pimeloyl-ACP methyl ester carboxylesterase